MSYPDELIEHLKSGATTLARAFALRRKDGMTLGFTDHDRDLEFGGVTYRADTGMTARAIQQMTGLAVDNTEAFGALSSDAITEEDILAGRYDGAEVVGWLVNWADPALRAEIFSGSIGEISRAAGAFTAELRGNADKLNQPRGQIYHARCSAVLGDKRCRFDLGQAGFHAELACEKVEEGRIFHLSTLQGFGDRFFEKGRLRLLEGRGQGLVGAIKNDRVLSGGLRVIELWQAFGIAPEAGDRIRLEAGCDRTADTCRLKFDNLLNFRGFPDIPGEDWLMAFPQRGGVNDGRSRGR